ncbi:MAG: hypothetical protein OER43_01930 [Gammaproteobacteria bacterium]|nr:hypothetical protein [Gammaproteobacteria bacterium]MDH3410937.1 hypothetical protein [Gammaproteobacteria bacterium]
MATSNYQRWLMAVGLLVALGVSIVFYRHALSYPGCCDVRQYVGMADFFAAHGFIANSPHSDTRTFGFPLFLSLLSRTARHVGVSLEGALFLTQLTMYFGCAAILYRQLSRSYGPSTGTAVFYGLTFNVLLLPYLSIPLTDGFSVILLLGAAILLIGVSTEHRPRMIVLRALLLGLVAGYAVVVRPANLWFCALIVIGGLLVFRKREQSSHRRSTIHAGLGAILFIGVSSLAGVLATTPQSALNWARAGKVSPFPIHDLKELQIDGGLRNIKYATSMVGTPSGIFYKNPLFHEIGEGIKGRMGVEWYFREPLRGAATIALHLFGGFDFDYLFPYIYDLRPDYRPALFLFSQLIVFFGFGGIVLLTFPRVAQQILGESVAAHFRWEAPITAGQVFVPVLVAWTAIYGLSSMENRFALPIVTMLMPVAVAALWVLIRLFRSGGIKQGLWILGGYLVWIAACLPLIQILEQAKQLPPL